MCTYIYLRIFRPFIQDVDMNLGKLWEMVRDRESMGLQRIRHDWVTEQQKQQQSVYLSLHLAGSDSLESSKTGPLSVSM